MGRVFGKGNHTGRHSVERAKVVVVGIGIVRWHEAIAWVDKHPPFLWLLIRPEGCSHTLIFFGLALWLLEKIPVRLVVVAEILICVCHLVSLIHA
jgi:hypothetical protein